MATNHSFLGTRMKSIISLIGLSILILIHTQSCNAKEPKNLDIIKQNYVKYHDSGEYLKDQAQVFHQAMEYLTIRLEKAKKTPGKKFAVILDIDETVLSNYPNFAARDFGGTYQQIVTDQNKGIDPVIEPALKFYRYAKQNNVAVFFISGRAENIRQITEKNLIAAGFKDWNGVYLKPVAYHNKSAVPYKIFQREAIEKQDYTIVLNIGDQKSDLMGGHADKVFKLPNPYYFIN